MALVSVVIPATEYSPLLEACLLSLQNQKNVNLEVWVVFNPTYPQFDSLRWPRWIHFLKSKRGVNCARNVGLRKSTSDLILFLDSDCELRDENHIYKLKKFAADHPEATGVGGSYKLPAFASVASKAYHYLQMDWLRQQIISSDFKSCALIGGHMLLRKSKLHGLEFEEKIIFGGSEREFFLRLFAVGAVFYLDLKTQVLHNSDLTPKELIKKAKAQGKGEKLIRSRSEVRQSEYQKYLIKPSMDSSWEPLILEYQRVFSKYSGAQKNQLHLFRKWLYTAMEHIQITQSKRD